MRLDGDEYGIDFRKGLRIVKSHEPSPIGFTVKIEDAQVHGARGFALICFLLSPHLKRACGFQLWLLVQVEGIEQKRPSACEEDTAKRLARAAAADDHEEAG